MAIDKAVDSAALNADLKRIADKIRAKGGTPGLYGSAAEMEAAVEAIPTGPSVITADMVQAGTFAGQVKANPSGQSSSGYVLRNQKVSLTAEDPTVEGEICWLAK